MSKKWRWTLALSLLLAACASVQWVDFDALYGEPSYQPRVTSQLAPGSIDYWSQVQPVLDKRCVVCHACYDAPCQLKLSSIEGIERGASTAQVYEATRLDEAPPTRLYQDAQTIAGWREKDFFPVLSEYPGQQQSYTRASVLYRMLELKEQHPLPDEPLLDKSFTLGLSRKNTCTTAGEFDKYAKDNPLWGMPYSMQGLPDDEQALIKRWIEQGARYTARPALAPEYQAQVDQWEVVFNREAIKSRLIARYIYEHLFLANLYFSELDPEDKGLPQYFRLVRSRTPPGEPIERINTRRPYEDPGVERVYYRLVPDVETVVVKTHQPFALNQARLERWERIFWNDSYQVTSLPGYIEPQTANPFAVFAQIPTNLRHQFLLDEAHFFIQGFIKGPVCRGQVALNVIRDHFWVFFVAPDHEANQVYADHLARQTPHLQIPSAEGATFSALLHWRRYAKQQQAYLEATDNQLVKIVDPLKDINLELFWDGDGSNDNAALTIFRHFDTASIFKGLLGGQPQTALALDYANLERIHYLLVAGYDVFGNLGHQLLSRLYMDFLRMEGEMVFLQFLPQEARDRERDYWYRGANNELKQYLTLPKFEQRSVPAIEYRTSEPKRELFGLLQRRMARVLPVERSLESMPEQPLKTQMLRLAELRGERVSWLPELMLIAVEPDDEQAEQPQVFSLIQNRHRTTMSSMFNEEKTLAPQVDTVSVLRGVAGAHPVAMVRLSESEVSAFVNAVFRLASEQDYRELMNTYGVRRSHPRFWEHVDQMHLQVQQQPLHDRGILDLNRLEDR